LNSTVQLKCCAEKLSWEKINVPYGVQCSTMFHKMKSWRIKILLVIQTKRASCNAHIASVHWITQQTFCSPFLINCRLVQYRLYLYRLS
jgi:hypothetical protein